MLRKILLWTLYVGFVGLLLFGATNRTLAKTGDSQRNSDNSLNDEIDLHEEQEHEPVAADSLIRMSVIVASQSNRNIILRGSDGASFEIAGRTWRFSKAQGFTVDIGDEVFLDGYFDDKGNFEMMSIHNPRTGMMLILRDESGRPLWAEEH